MDSITPAASGKANSSASGKTWQPDENGYDALYSKKFRSFMEGPDKDNPFLPDPETGIARVEPPVNIAADSTYRGENFLILAMNAAEKGWPTSEYIPESVAAEGHFVPKRGERSTDIIVRKLNDSAYAAAFKAEGDKIEKAMLAKDPSLAGNRKALTEKVNRLASAEAFVRAYRFESARPMFNVAQFADPDAVRAWALERVRASYEKAINAGSPYVSRFTAGSDGKAVFKDRSATDKGGSSDFALPSAMSLTASDYIGHLISASSNNSVMVVRKEDIPAVKEALVSAVCGKVVSKTTGKEHIRTQAFRNLALKAAEPEKFWDSCAERHAASLASKEQEKAEVNDRKLPAKSKEVEKTRAIEGPARTL
jgi:hypothetical protein